MDSKVPRRIIQIWGGGGSLPLLAQASSANARLLNPDFEYLLFDDAKMGEFLATQPKEYIDVFHSLRLPIQKYDFFRYLAVYRLGGFYLDMDVLLVKSLSQLTQYECVFPFESLSINNFLRERCGMDWEIGNYAFGARAEHPFLRAIIDSCVKAQNDPTWAEGMVRSIPRMFRDCYVPLYTTGPLLVSRTLAEFPDVGKQVKVLFPEDVCDMTKWCQFGDVGIHLMDGRWRKPAGILKRRLRVMWQLILERRMYKESRKIGPSRALEFQVERGSGNSGSVVSGRPASPRPPRGGKIKEHGNEPYKTEFGE